MNLKEDYLYQKGYRKIIKCPICGEDTLDFYFICPNRVLLCYNISNDNSKR